MKDINEVFSELDSRIDILKRLTTIANVGELLGEDFDISRIERNIRRFEGDAIPRLDVALKELKDLEKRGRAILSNVVLYDEYYKKIQLTAKNTKANELKKEEYYDLIKKEIGFYIKKLNTLRTSLQSQTTETDKKKYTISIGADFDFPKLKRLNPEIQTVLTKEQIGLLFHYLMEKNIIFTYDAKAISKIVSMFTGISDEILRREVFGQIHSIKKDIPHSSKKSNKQLTNLDFLKNILNDIILEIDKELKKAPSRK